jgi:hypothetical protein
MNEELKENLKDWLPQEPLPLNNEMLTVSDCVSLVGIFLRHYSINIGTSEAVLKKELIALFEDLNTEVSNDEYQLNRWEFALILDKMVNPFELRQVDHRGHWSNN